MKKQNVLTVGIEGLRGFIVSIETIVKRGLFHFDIVGLANKTVSESKQRILSALQSSNIESPKHSHKKIVTLLSPADEKKNGSHFDLPIAVSYLISSFNLKVDVSKIIFIGELTLSGHVLHVKNIDKIVHTARKFGFTQIVVPEENIKDTLMFKDMAFWPIRHLKEIYSELVSKNNISRENFWTNKSIQNGAGQNIKDKKGDRAEDETEPIRQDHFLIDSITGQETTKRAMEIALSGKHHILLIGEPGIGKSLLAKSAQEMIPNISDREHTEMLAHFGSDKSSGTYKDKNLRVNFREPHHTASYTEILGGKKSAGEIALSHRGVLFIDELLECNRRVLEGLREPLETNSINHTDLGKVYSDFILIGSTNPCACGNAQAKNKKCYCSPSQTDRYLRKLKSPLFQRIEIQVQMTAESKISKSKTSGLSMKGCILRVRKIQQEREFRVAQKYNLPIENPDDVYKYKKEIRLYLETEMREKITENEDVLRIFEEVVVGFNLSKRVQGNLLLVTQTIADLDSVKSDLSCTSGFGLDVSNSSALKPIEPKHILEAISYIQKGD